MRVLVVSGWYPPVMSGSSLWAQSLTLALRKRGHEVPVVTTRIPVEPPAGSRTCGRLDGAGDEAGVYRLPAWTLPRSRLLLGLANVPVAFSRANRRRILEIVGEFKPDIIHQISHIHDTLLLSAYAARRTGTPLVGSITTPIQSPSRLHHALLAAADLAVPYHFGVRHWRRIICSDSTQARYVRERYGRRVEGRVVTGIHAGIHQRVQQVAPEPKTPWPQIVSVGHVHPIRDPTNLIRAMPEVLGRFPDARLDIAGRVQFQRPVREVRRLGIEGAVRFLGEVPVEEVARLVSRAHVFAVLHQCRYAGLSFTAAEAMQFGTPVVINAPSDTYGPGVLRDGEHLVLVGGGDAAEIAAKLIALLGSPELRARIGAGGRRFVAEHLSWDLCAEKTERLYEELLRGG